MIMNHIIVFATIVVLFFIAYKDYKQRIIPDLSVVFVFILSSVYFFINDGVFIDFIFYIFFASVPIFIISFIVDSLSSEKIKIIDYIILFVSIISGLLVPLNFKMKYIIACGVLLVLVLIESFFVKEDNTDQDQEGFSIGGGDIKLIAALGPMFKEQMIIFLFFSFLLAYLFMKVKKKSNIYLAPFMFFTFIVFSIIQIGGSFI